MVDGYGVFKANPTFSVPEVRVAITFQAERFSYLLGNGTRDDVGKRARPWLRVRERFHGR